MTEMAADGAQHARRAGGHVATQEPRAGFGAQDVHRPGMRHGRRDGAEADPLRNVEPFGKFGSSLGERLPAIIGLRSREDEDVVVADSRVANGECGPLELGRAPVDDLERGPAGAVVEQLVGVEGREHAAAFGELLRGHRGGRTCVDPAVERRDEGRRDELPDLLQPIDRHASKDRRRIRRCSRG